ncbi:MAG: helix-turn-helix domain-containing protein [Ruminococcus sp.]|jgi:transcriptional regulator with XRE-family HTH domain
MENMLQIGSRIKRQRILLGYTREYLAELVNVTPRFCYDLELGLKGMSLDTLCRLSKALKVTTDYLLFGTEHDGDADHLLTLIQSCPPEKREQLDVIISSFVQAVS